MLPKAIPALIWPTCVPVKRQTETGKGDCYRVVMAWERVSRLKTIPYGSNQPAAGNSKTGRYSRKMILHPSNR
jgi:hypothetical protein